MIKSMTLLKHECSIEDCRSRADFQVERSNDELEGKTSPSGHAYYTHGTRMIYYCTSHAPEEVRKLWRAEEDDAGPLVAKHKFDHLS